MSVECDLIYYLYLVRKFRMHRDYVGLSLLTIESCAIVYSQTWQHCQLCLTCFCYSSHPLDSHQVDRSWGCPLQPLHHQVWCVVLWCPPVRDSRIRAIPLPWHEQPSGLGGSHNRLPHALPQWVSRCLVWDHAGVLAGQPWITAHVWDLAVEAWGILHWGWWLNWLSPYR